jgi:hypothetical protein
MGLKHSEKNHRVTASIITPKGKLVASNSVNDPAKPIVIKANMLKKGNYLMRLNVSGAKQTLTVPFKTINGPFGE